MSQFIPGNVVRLRSGGPLMTVRGNQPPPPEYTVSYALAGNAPSTKPTYRFERPVTCDWFMADERDLRTAVFEEAQLKLVGEGGAG